MVNLNYDAHVPFTHQGIDVTEAAPFIVKADPNVPPGTRNKGRNSDYIPNPSREENSVVSVQNDNQRVHTGKVIVRGPNDYVSRQETDKIISKERSLIVEMAKELYNKQAKRRRDYKEARKLLDKAKPEDLEEKNMTPELHRAIKIVSKGKPISKDRALELATKKHYSKVNER